LKLSPERVADLLAADRPRADHGSGAALATGYSIDSRTIAPGEVFFAVRGERLDGHDYVVQAMERGALAAVVERDELGRFPDRTRLLAVDDTLAALQRLAAAVRQLWGKKVIAITGSAGKTTTKEILARLLATRYRLLKSEGNFNNHFGLPLQMLRLEPEHDLAVLELGMSHLGEITALAALARPDLGVVTNVAPVHLGFFKSVAEIARAKKELIDALPADGIAVLNADDEYVSEFGREFAGRVITFALKHPADVRADFLVQRGSAGSEFDPDRRAQCLQRPGRRGRGRLLRHPAGCRGCRTGPSGPGGKARRGLADWRGNRGQRLLQFQSESAGQHGGRAGRHRACRWRPAHRGGRRNARTGPGR
jgi:UDP-N-acetylmuramoyl-tripeptide--D-alanyl-D-alanine ligase